jgi:hypothetical protein
MSDSECLCLLPSTALNQACGIWILNRVENDNSVLWMPSYVVDDDGSGYTEVAMHSKPRHTRPRSGIQMSTANAFEFYKVQC